jgi:hypothetical protein
MQRDLSPPAAVVFLATGEREQDANLVEGKAETAAGANVK